MTEKKYLFVAEAGTEVGLGSLSRCVHLANKIALKDKSISVTILTNMPFGVKFLKKNKTIAKTCFYEEGELCNKLMDVCDENTCLIITEDRLINSCKELKFKKLIVIGDFTLNCTYAIDLFITSMRNSVPKVNYIKESMIGPDYHFVHMDQELIKSYVFREKIGGVLVSMGGSDYRDLTVSISGVLFNNLSNARISVMLGSCTHRVGFAEKRISGISDSIEIRRKQQNISNDIVQFDLAITKPGVTCYELLSIGMPVMLISTNDHHKEIANHLHELGAVCYLGHWDEINSEILQEKIKWISENPEIRHQLSKNARKLIDGNGLVRVLEKILSIE